MVTSIDDAFTRLLHVTTSVTDARNVALERRQSMPVLSFCRLSYACRQRFLIYFPLFILFLSSSFFVDTLLMPAFADAAPFRA